MSSVHISLAPNSATMDDFHALLRTLMSPDNASRQQAEQAYDGVKQQNPGMLLSCLAQTVRSCADATLRAFGAVLLRRAALCVALGEPALARQVLGVRIGLGVRVRC